MGDNVIQVKSYQFASRIIKLVLFLQKGKEYVLSKQILRSGTSIGANVEEAIWWQTRKEFFSKFSIAYKECRETKYRLNLLKDNGYLEQPMFDSFSDDLSLLVKIIVSIQKTTKMKK